ncbi:MAG: hypothetical protein AAB444_01410 [Patescibacteria group bacterium]
MSMDHESNQEILEAIHEFSTHVDTRFEDVNKRFEDVTQEIGKAKIDILDAVDDKLVNLKGDLILLMRSEDKKLLYLVQVLKNKKILTEEETRNILKLQPFPQAL